MAYPVVEIIAGRKLCSRCGETKPTRAFVRNHTVECGLNSTCRMCDRTRRGEFRRRRLCWVCCSPLRRRSNGRSYCQHCADVRRAKYDRRKAAGLCTDCAEPPAPVAPPSTVYCAIHLERRRRYLRDYMRRKRARQRQARTTNQK